MIDWNAVGAIGQILGAIITFIVGCIALRPYMKKCDVFFSFMNNTKNKPTFVVTNYSQKGQFINRIIMYSGRWKKKTFCELEMFDIKDDLLLDNTEFFIKPNSYFKISASANRMMEYITHCDVYLSKRKKVYIQLDFGNKLSKRFCTKIRTYDFLVMLTSQADSFKEYNVNTLFTKK